MISVGIVGLGRWGRRLVDSVQHAGKPAGSVLRVTHAVVRTAEAASDYAASQSLRLGTSYEALLADPGVDAVLLATPHDQHAAQILAAIEAGKHIFVEKPLALTFADAHAAVAAAERAGVVLGVGHNRRFLPATAALRGLISSGELGTLVHVEGNFSNNSGLAYTPAMWRSSEAGSKAAMTAMGVHLLDLLVHLCGPIDNVSAIGTRHAMPVDVNGVVCVNLRFRAGLTGFISTMLSTPRQWRVQVFGTQGWAHMRDEDVLDVCDAAGKVRTLRFDATDTLRLELEAFAHAIAGRETYPISAADLMHVPAALEAVLTSSDAAGAMTPVAGLMPRP